MQAAGGGAPQPSGSSGGSKDAVLQQLEQLNAEVKELAAKLDKARDAWLNNREDKDLKDVYNDLKGDKAQLDERRKALEANLLPGPGAAGTSVAGSAGRQPMPYDPDSVAQLAEAMTPKLLEAIAEQMAPIVATNSKLMAEYRLRVFAPIGSNASSHQERNIKLKDSAIVEYGADLDAPKGHLRCHLLNQFMPKRSVICSHIFRLDWAREKACVGLQNLDVVRNVLFLNRFVEMALDRFWLIFVVQPELQHASLTAGNGHASISSTASNSSKASTNARTKVTTKYTPGSTLVAHWLGDPNVQPACDDQWPFGYAGCTEHQWEDIQRVFGNRTVAETIDRKSVTWAEGKDMRPYYRCFMTQASSAIRYGLTYERITPQWLTDRGLSMEEILHPEEGVSPEGSQLVKRYMNDLDNKLCEQNFQPTRSEASVPEENISE